MEKEEIQLMESRLIYAAANAGKFNIDWLQDSGNEWIYTGVEEDVREEAVSEQIDNFFGDEEILLVLGRENSKSLESCEINKEVLERIGRENFSLCDTDFTKFMEFNKIGVLRLGKRRESTSRSA